MRGLRSDLVGSGLRRRKQGLGASDRFDLGLQRLAGRQDLGQLRLDRTQVPPDFIATGGGVDLGNGGLSRPLVQARKGLLDEDVDAGIGHPQQALPHLGVIGYLRQLPLADAGNLGEDAAR